MPVPSSLRNMANWVKGKIPSLGKGDGDDPRGAGDEVSVKPLLAYFVVHHMEEQSWGITRNNLQKAFREATRSLQTSGFVQKGSHQPTELGIKAMNVMRDRDDYWEAQDKYADWLESVRTGAPRRYKESLEYRANIVEDKDNNKDAILAIYPPKEVVEKIFNISDNVDKDDLHITLFCFDGMNPDRLGDISRSIRECLPIVSEINISIVGAGVFINDSGNIDHLLVSSPDLDSLRTVLSVKFDDHGIEFNNKYGWVPHITIGQDSSAPVDFNEIEPKDIDIDWKSDKISLVDNFDIIESFDLGRA